MVHCCGDTPALPFLIKITVNRTVCVARHGNQQMPGFQKLFHGDLPACQRVVCPHCENKSAIKKPGTPQTVIVLVKHANREVNVS